VPDRNYYEVLGLSKSSGVDDIHSAYLEKLQQVHPDRNGGDDDACHERTIEVVGAYRVLSDLQARKRYDFRCGNSFRVDGDLPGFKILKGRRSLEAEARFAEAGLHIKGDDLIKAVEPLKAALKLEPSYPAAAYNLALTGALLENTAYALDVLADGIRMSPGDKTLHRLRAAVLSTYMTV